MMIVMMLVFFWDDSDDDADDADAVEAFAEFVVLAGGARGVRCVREEEEREAALAEGRAPRSGTVFMGGVAGMLVGAFGVPDATDGGAAALKLDEDMNEGGEGGEVYALDFQGGGDSYGADLRNAYTYTMSLCDGSLYGMGKHDDDELDHEGEDCVAVGDRIGVLVLV